jgi:hypothetical protein
MFINSAVECQPSDGGMDDACNGTLWLDCSCCLNRKDAESCPLEIPPSFDDGSEEASTFQGFSACDSSVFADSDVTCTAAESCPYTVLFKSKAHFTETSACTFATFFDSAIDCGMGGACGEANWMLCSCCNASDACPVDAEACYDNGSPDHFCNTTFLGQTCKDCDNPICSGNLMSIHFRPSIRQQHAQKTRTLLNVLAIVRWRHKP